MKAFVPFRDEWLEHPELMPANLVPYQCGVPCEHELAPANDDQCTGPTGPSSVNASPA